MRLPFIHHNTTPTNKTLVAVILFSFLTTFALSRLVVYFVVDNLLPNFFLTIKGVHIHHFTYGVLILAAAGLYLLLRRPNPETSDFKWLTVLYGIGLGLTFDEFGMWVRLEDEYWIRQSYDAIIIISLLFLNLIYHRWVIRGIRELGLLVKKAIF